MNKNSERLYQPDQASSIWYKSHGNKLVSTRKTWIRLLMLFHLAYGVLTLYPSFLFSSNLTNGQQLLSKRYNIHIHFWQPFYRFQLYTQWTARCFELHVFI